MGTHMFQYGTNMHPLRVNKVHTGTFEGTTLVG